MNLIRVISLTAALLASSYTNAGIITGSFSGFVTNDLDVANSIKNQYLNEQISGSFALDLSPTSLSDVCTSADVNCLRDPSFQTEWVSIEYYLQGNRYTHELATSNTKWDLIDLSYSSSATPNQLFISDRDYNSVTRDDSFVQLDFLDAANATQPLLSSTDILALAGQTWDDTDSPGGAGSNGTYGVMRAYTQLNNQSTFTDLYASITSLTFAPLASEDSSQVPIPGTLSLLALGLIGLKRRKVQCFTA